MVVTLCVGVAGGVGEGEGNNSITHPLPLFFKKKGSFFVICYCFEGVYVLCDNGPGLGRLVLEFW